MIVLCHTAKGGCGTTTVAASLGILDPHRPTLLVDLAGDLPLALGLDAGDRPGVIDWLRSDAAPRQLDAIVHDLDGRSEILTARRGGLDGGSSPPDRPGHDAIEERRWARLATWLLDRSTVDGRSVVIDAGTGDVGTGLLDACTHRLLVTRRCYLAVRHAENAAIPPTGIAVVSEPGRALSSRDVAHNVGAAVLAELPTDPAVARAIDSGLLHSRRGLRAWSRSVGSLWNALDRAADTRNAA